MGLFSKMIKSLRQRVIKIKISEIWSENSKNIAKIIMTDPINFDFEKRINSYIILGNGAALATLFTILAANIDKISLTDLLVSSAPIFFFGLVSAIIGEVLLVFCFSAHINFRQEFTQSEYSFQTKKHLIIYKSLFFTWLISVVLSVLFFVYGIHSMIKSVSDRNDLANVLVSASGSHLENNKINFWISNNSGRTVIVYSANFVVRFGNQSRSQLLVSNGSDNPFLVSNEIRKISLELPDLEVARRLFDDFVLSQSPTCWLAPSVFDGIYRMPIRDIRVRCDFVIPNSQSVNDK